MHSAWHMSPSMVVASRRNALYNFSLFQAAFTMTFFRATRPLPQLYVPSGHLSLAPEYLYV
jgi:hypothetical protein